MSGGSSMGKRILSGIIALPVYFFCIGTDLFGSLPVLAASMVISICCLYEFYQICHQPDRGKPFYAVGIAGAVLINIVMYLYGFGKIFGYTRYIQAFDARILFALIALFIITISIIQLFKRPIPGGIYSLAVTVFGLAYIVLFFSHIILMKALKDGFYYILVLNIVVMLNDTAAYFGGVFFGKHKTGFAVSPNKSWEGYFFGLLFSVLGFIITAQAFEIFFGKALFTMIEAALLGIFLSAAGNCGDLIESAVKRDGSIKDSGSLVPGHGGMWDVFDALIFVLPVFYYYLIAKGVQ